MMSLLSQQASKEESKDDYVKLAAQLKQNLYKEDKQAANHIKSEGLKALFNFLINMSYAFFSFGILLTFQDGGLNQQSIIQYVQSLRNKILLIVLALLGFTIMTTLKTIKEENTLTAAFKKKVNFYIDIARTIFFIIAIVFIAPFVFENETFVLLLAFVIFCISLALFIIRKSVKWVYYRGEGNNILGPWESKDTSDIINIAKILHLIDAYIHKEQKPEDKTEGQITKDQIQRLQFLQKQLKQNQIKREQILASIRKIVN